MGKTMGRTTLLFFYKGTKRGRGEVMLVSKGFSGEVTLEGSYNRFLLVSVNTEKNVHLFW